MKARVIKLCALLLCATLLCYAAFEAGIKHAPQPEPVTIEVPVEVAKTPVRTFAGTMRRVFSIGREVGHPETLQAILLQETGGGRSEMIGNKSSPIGKKSYGVMQVQLVAARSVLQRFPALTKKFFPGRTYGSLVDEEIIALLLTNDEANIRIAAHHFKLYLSICGNDWDCAVAAYNMGIGNAINTSNHSEIAYVVDVKEKMENDVRQFNQRSGLRS